MKTCHIPIKCIATSIPAKCGNDNCNLHANHLCWAQAQDVRGTKTPGLTCGAPKLQGLLVHFTFSGGAGGRGERKKAFQGSKPIKSCRCEDILEFPKRQAAQGQTVSNQWRANYSVTAKVQ